MSGPTQSPTQVARFYADRRSTFDVTNTVDVSSVTSVRDAVQALFQDIYPRTSFDPVWMAFHDFDDLFEGRFPGYVGCDTVYHDKQHSLDVTLATARLLAAHEKTATAGKCLGTERSVMALVTALFHDAGYIRRRDEPKRLNGAEYTLWHVSRSADFLRAYMARAGLGEQAGTAVRLVHFTGYEIDIDDIEVPDQLDRQVGYFLGTADLIAQMADRCYLEKCRDSLYSEFVLGGVAAKRSPAGTPEVLYGSGVDLLKKTPGFFTMSARVRLDQKFHESYRKIGALFDGHNPYMESMRSNFDYLERLIKSGNFEGLRRRPPCFTVLSRPHRSVNALVSRHLACLNAPASALTTN